MFVADQFTAGVVAFGLFAGFFPPSLLQEHMAPAAAVQQLCLTSCAFDCARCSMLVCPACRTWSAASVAEQQEANAAAFGAAFVCSTNFSTVTALAPASSERCRSVSLVFRCLSGLSGLQSSNLWLLIQRLQHRLVHDHLSHYSAENQAFLAAGWVTPVVHISAGNQAFWWLGGWHLLCLMFCME